MTGSTEGALRAGTYTARAFEALFVQPGLDPPQALFDLLQFV
jgi:hypothetical protein